MQRKTFVVLVTMVLVVAIGMQLGLSQEKEEKTELDSAKIMRKLDEVLANQAKIIEQFDEIKQELEVIKVRASR